MGRRIVYAAVLIALLSAASLARADETALFQSYLARAQNGEPYAMEMLGAAYEQGSFGATPELSRSFQVVP